MQPSTTSTSVPTWLWSVGAFILVLAATLVPLIGVVILAPLVALLVGGVAADWSTYHSGGTLGRMAALGAIAGIGALLADAAFALLGIVAFAPMGIDQASGLSVLAFGAVIALGAGLVNLALATLGGLLVGLFRGGAGAPRLRGQPR